jgi:hypothetical protein
MPITPTRGTRYQRNRLNGITITRVFMVDTIEEADTVAPEGSLYGIPEDEREAQQENEGKGRFKVTITYRGAKDDTPANKERWSGKIVVREEPIESCPIFEELKAKYQGRINPQTKRVEWPETITARSGNLGSAGVKQRNPMFGAKTYPVQEGEVQHSYIRKKFPGDFYNKLGKVLKRLPGGSGIPTPTGYVWVTMTPEFEGMGPDAWSLKDNYRLTKEDSFTAIIHSLIRR